MSEEVSQLGMYEVRYSVKYIIEPEMYFSSGIFNIYVTTKAEVTLRILDKNGKEITSKVETFYYSDPLEEIDVRLAFRDLSEKVGDFVNDIEKKLKKLEETIKTFNEITE